MATAPGRWHLPRPHLGAQSNLHCVGELLHARQQARAALIAETQILSGVAAGLDGIKSLRAAVRGRDGGGGGPLDSGMGD